METYGKTNSCGNLRQGRALEIASQKESRAEQSRESACSFDGKKKPIRGTYAQKPMPSLSANDVAEFHLRIRKQHEGNDCHEWARGITGRGYGAFHRHNTQYSTHRVAYKLAHPEWDETDFVLHKCDNRRCVNPDHLFLGDHGDNMRDMVAKGRCPRSRHLNKTVKISTELAADLVQQYKAGATQKQLATKYQVTQACISWIITKSLGAFYKRKLYKLTPNKQK